MFKKNNIAQIRQDFPILTQNSPQPVIYFDNACQTLRPNSVIKAISEYYRHYPACAGRSGHRLGRRVTEEVALAREKVRKFLNAKKAAEIVFIRNTTEGINLIAQSLDWQPGDMVLTTDKEHNSNLVPWQILSRKQEITHQIAPSLPNGEFDLDRFDSYFNKKIKLVSMVLTSNLDGVTLPAKKIIEIAHRHGALVLLDAAQAAPHQKIDVRNLDVDFLAFSGHKMLGPSGIGVLYGKEKLLNNLKPFLVGGDTVAKTTYNDHQFLPIPEKFEAGLQNYAGIIGLGAAIDYLQKIGWRFIQKQEEKLNRLASQKLQKITGVNILGPKDPQKRGGILSFFIKGVDAHRLALILDESAGVMMRSGQHCVHSWFAKHQITGSIRASFYFYNTEEEVNIFIRQLQKALRILK